MLVQSKVGHASVASPLRWLHISPAGMVTSNLCDNLVHLLAVSQVDGIDHASAISFNREVPRSSDHGILNRRVLSCWVVGRYSFVLTDDICQWNPAVAKVGAQVFV